MLEFENVTIKNGLRTLIDRLSFTAADGSVTALCGKNGSGKTSLLRAVIGARKYGGTIRIDGRDLAGLKPSERAALVSYMPQVLPMPELTVRELILSALSSGKGVLYRPDRAAEEKASEILEQCRLTYIENSSLLEISGGERQRAYFAVITALDTPVVLLDEPTANLDDESRAMVYGFIEELKKRGKTVVVVLHHEARARAVADSIIRL